MVHRSMWVDFFENIFCKVLGSHIPNQLWIALVWLWTLWAHICCCGQWSLANFQIDR